MDPATAMLSGGNPGGGSPPAAGGTPPGTGGVSPPAAGGNGAGAGGPPPGAGAFSWSPDLPQEVTSLLQAKAFDKDPNALANAYWHANKALSGAKDVLVIPADGQPLDPVYEALGRPKTPDEYPKFKYKDGVSIDAEFEKFGRSFFHELGVPASKVQAALDKWQDFAVGRVAGDMAAHQHANEKQIADLETNLGKDKFSKYVADGQIAFKALGLPPEVNAFVEKHAGAAAVLHIYAKLGEKMGGESAVIGNGAGQGVLDPANMTLQQAEQAMKTLEADKEFMEAYNTAKHPKHDEAVHRMLKLQDTVVARRRGMATP